jgi:hypothetical protein
MPVKLIESATHLVGKIRESPDDLSELDGLRKHLLGRREVVLCALHSCADALGPRHQIFEVHRAGFICVAQAAQGIFVSLKRALGFVALLPQRTDRPIAGTAARPLIKYSSWVLQHCADGIPHIAVELVDAHLWIMTDASAFKAIRVGSDTAIVSVGRSAFPRGERNDLAVKRVATMCAQCEPLEQVTESTSVAFRQSFIPSELFLRLSEDFGRNDRRHANRDPVLLLFVTIRALGSSGRCISAADRTEQLASFHHLGLAECRLPHIGRIAQHGPYRRTIPFRFARASRDALRVESSDNLANRHLLLDEPLEHGAHHPRLGEHDLISRGLRVCFSDIEIAVRSSTERIDDARARLMQLSPSRALEDFRSFVFGDHSLDLDQQFVLGRLAVRAIEENDARARPRKLVEKQHLVRVFSRESIGTVNIQDVDAMVRDAISQSLEFGTDQRGSTESLVDVSIRRKDQLSIRDRTFFECGDLTRNRRLLRLLLGRDARIDRHGLHRAWSTPSRCGLLLGCDATTRLRICTRRIGATISYAKRSCSGPSRLGSKRRLSWMGFRRGTGGSIGSLRSDVQIFAPPPHGFLRPSRVLRRSAPRVIEVCQ